MCIYIIIYHVFIYISEYIQIFTHGLLEEWYLDIWGYTDETLRNSATFRIMNQKYSYKIKYIIRYWAATSVMRIDSTVFTRKNKQKSNSCFAGGAQETFGGNEYTYSLWWWSWYRTIRHMPKLIKMYTLRCAFLYIKYTLAKLEK